MSNEKKYFISFMFGVVLTAVLCTTAFFRYYLRQSESYREQNERLTEQYKSVRSELNAVRSSIKQSRECVEQSRSDIYEIESAIERIRKETKILQDYYDSTSSLCRD